MPWAPPGRFSIPTLTATTRRAGAPALRRPVIVQDLVAFARGGIIVERLNAFAPSNAWDGPSIRSLSEAVVDAVGAAPRTFVDQLPRFSQCEAGIPIRHHRRLQKAMGRLGWKTGGLRLEPDVAEAHRFL